MVTKDTPVEEIAEIEGVFEYCLGQGVSLVACSGALSQPLGKLLEVKRIKNPRAFIAGLNSFLRGAAEDEV